LSPDDGLPNLPSVELVMQRKDNGLSEAAEQLARFIVMALDDTNST
jgi:hypothetical protein